MDLELSDDQVALRDGIRALLTDRFPMERVREGFTREVYDELDAAGVFSLVRDGFTWADAAVVFEQLGEFGVPGPLVGTLLARGPLEGVVGVHEVADELIVEHAGVLDDLVVLDGARVVVQPASARSGPELEWPLDPLSPAVRVARGALVGGATLNVDADEWRRRGAVLTAALLVGIAQRCTDLSVGYAKEREQFGRTIGSFQAVKHLLADMVVRTEVARAAVYAAVAHLDEAEQPDLDRAVSVAKLMAGEAAIANGKTATQVHGGMGFTWEVDVHLFLKRAWVLDTHFGSVDHHADVVAATLS
ncbi:MAG TPA: acyl-CoA dehydrogenase family protein [Acidimicrobiia bacterium]|nr:acyl-CoA dehydrogenase family protein [Acidimicrobiia bacterium]